MRRSTTEERDSALILVLCKSASQSTPMEVQGGRSRKEMGMLKEMGMQERDGHTGISWAYRN